MAEGKRLTVNLLVQSLLREVLHRHPRHRPRHEALQKKVRGCADVGHILPVQLPVWQGQQSGLAGSTGIRLQLS